MQSGTFLLTVRDLQLTDKNRPQAPEVLMLGLLITLLYLSLMSISDEFLFNKNTATAE
jgi:hypothetical protein